MDSSASGRTAEAVLHFHSTQSIFRVRGVAHIVCSDSSSLQSNLPVWAKACSVPWEEWRKELVQDDCDLVLLDADQVEISHEQEEECSIFQVQQHPLSFGACFSSKWETTSIY